MRIKRAGWNQWNIWVSQKLVGWVKRRNRGVYEVRWGDWAYNGNYARLGQAARHIYRQVVVEGEE